jgi:hypothetical protein
MNQNPPKTSQQESHSELENCLLDSALSLTTDVQKQTEEPKSELDSLIYEEQAEKCDQMLNNRDL